MDNLREIYEDKVLELQTTCDDLRSNLQSALNSATETAGQAVTVSSTDDKIVRSWETRVESLQAQIASQRTASDEEMAKIVRQHAKEVASFRADIDILEQQLGSGKGQGALLAQAEEEIIFHKKERSTLCAEIEQQKKQLAVAAKNESRMKAMQNQVDFLSEQVTLLKVEKNQCEAEYISLMDVKVALDMEIRAYRLLLENEEHRLEPAPAPVVEADTKHVEEEEEIPVSSKKRTRNSSATTPAPKAKRSRQGTARKSSRKKQVIVEEDDDEVSPTFVITSADSSKAIVVKNATKQNQCLDGWSLKVESSKKVFMFPDAAAVKPGKTVTVWLGGGRKPKDAVEWAEDDIFAVQDQVSLKSPEGFGHSTVDV